MKKQWKAIAVLLMFTTPVVAWAAGSEFGRNDIPPLVNENGVVLEVRGLFEAKGLEDQLIAVYRDPMDGSHSFAAIPGTTSGKDALDIGHLKLEVTFDDHGGLKTVELWEAGSWSTVQKLDVKAATTAKRPLPDFDQVPKARNPCEGRYLHSRWILGCLIDYFSDCPSGGPEGTIACCDGGVDPNGGAAPDCQKDYGVPLAVFR